MPVDVLNTFFEKAQSSYLSITTSYLSIVTSNLSVTRGHETVTLKSDVVMLRIYVIALKRSTLMLKISFRPHLLIGCIIVIIADPLRTAAESGGYAAPVAEGLKLAKDADHSLDDTHLIPAPTFKMFAAIF
jgi:hypothetical protein